MSDTTSLHHIVINTYRRAMTIGEDACSDMYGVLGKLVKEKGAYPLIINGIGNHVHLLIDFGPYTARADLLKHIKHNSSYWAARCGKFPMWEGWGREYFCYSVSADRRDTVISYIKKQKQHHLHRDYEQEMRHMVQNAGMNGMNKNNRADLLLADI